MPVRAMPNCKDMLPSIRKKPAAQAHATTNSFCCVICSHSPGLHSRAFISSCHCARTVQPIHRVFKLLQMSGSNGYKLTSEPLHCILQSSATLSHC